MFMDSSWSSHLGGAVATKVERDHIWIVQATCEHATRDKTLLQYWLDLGLWPWSIFKQWVNISLGHLYLDAS